MNFLALWTFSILQIIFLTPIPSTSSSFLQEYFVDREHDLIHPWSAGNGSWTDPPFLWYYESLTSVPEVDFDYFQYHGVNLTSLFRDSEGVWATFWNGTISRTEKLFPFIELALDSGDEFIVQVVLSFYQSSGARLVLEVDGREEETNVVEGRLLDSNTTDWVTRVVDNVFGKKVRILMKTWTGDDFILLDKILILTEVGHFTTPKPTTTSVKTSTTPWIDTTTTELEQRPPCSELSTETMATFSQNYFATGDPDNDTTMHATEESSEPSTLFDETMTTIMTTDMISTTTEDEDYYFVKYSLDTDQDLVHPWTFSMMNDSDPDWFWYYENVTSMPESIWDFLFYNGVDLCNFQRDEGIWTRITGNNPTDFFPFIEIFLDSKDEYIIQVGISFYASLGASLVLVVDGRDETEIWEEDMMSITKWTIKVVNVSYGKSARFYFKTYTVGDFILIDKIRVKTIKNGNPPTTTEASITSPEEEETPHWTTTSEKNFTTEDTSTLSTSDGDATTEIISKEPETTTERNGSNSVFISFNYASLIACMQLLFIMLMHTFLSF